MIRQLITLVFVSGCAAAAYAAPRPSVNCPKILKSTSAGQLKTPNDSHGVNFAVSTLTPGKHNTYRLVDTWLTDFDDKARAYHNLMCNYANQTNPHAIGLHLSANGHFKHLPNDNHFTDDIDQSFCQASDDNKSTCRVIT